MSDISRIVRPRPRDRTRARRHAAPKYRPRKMSSVEPSAMTNLRDPQPQHDAIALTAGGNSAQIRLNDQVYTLRITRQGKLILTK